MNIASHAKKGTGLDDLFKEYAPQQLEEQSHVKIAEVAAGTLEGYVNLYKSCLNETFKVEEIMPRIKNPLAPQKIKAFVEATAPQGYPEREENEWPRTGRKPGIGIMFLNQLIQTSYDSGLNDFILSNVGFPYLGHNLHGRKDNPLRIKIEGDVGEHFCGNSSYIDVTLHGDCGSCSAQSMDHSCMTIHGKVDGSSVGIDSNKTVFRTSDQETFWALINCYEPARGNTIRFIGRNGERTSMNQLKNARTSALLSLSDAIIYLMILDREILSVSSEEMGKRTSANQLKNAGTSALSSAADAVTYLKRSYEFIRYDVIEKGVDCLIENRTKKVKREKRP